MEQSSFKNRFKKLFWLFCLSFVSLFLLRLLYGFIFYSEDQVGNAQFNQFQQGSSPIFDVDRKNYASIRKESKGGGYDPGLATGGVLQQKYEKVGSVSSATQEFSKHEKEVRDLVVDFKALIQFEESSGLEGRRFLRLAIGVNPDKFDNMMEKIQKIGSLTSIQINKTDKTNEFKELNAERASLEKTRNALVALKGKSGKIQELIELENKILEKEEQIQKLGVKLGEFDEENEFCTVKFSLTETGQKISKGFFQKFVHRLKVAFEWTVKYYLLMALLVLFASLCILIFLLIVERLGLIQELFRRGIIEPMEKKETSLAQESSLEKENPKNLRKKGKE